MSAYLRRTSPLYRRHRRAQDLAGLFLPKIPDCALGSIRRLDQCCGLCNRGDHDVLPRSIRVRHSWKLCDEAGHWQMRLVPHPQYHWIYTWRTERAHGLGVSGTGHPFPDPNQDVTGSKGVLLWHSAPRSGRKHCQYRTNRLHS